VADKSRANPEVLAFYRDLPFNYRETAHRDVARVKASDAVANYPVLPPLLTERTRVLEVGCGAGWLSNSIAYHYRSSVISIDFNSVAIARAREVASGLRVPVSFETADLFLYRPSVPADLAISLGVLHHTNDCLGAVRRMCTEFVRPGGRVFIGLYHTYGRRPFLNYFAEMRARGASEEEMLARYASLDRRFDDQTHLMSWFRDQVLHPHETQHTLAEILPVLKECGMALESTSINRFQPFRSLDELRNQEKSYAQIGEERLAEGTYFPGFFVFLARRDGLE
jgi:2-polyprenyl-3-methyl-5-hydroxy-6-metoxy-1,4-benzoquinol methylase